jgi:nucleotide-binding universal stress UspA family protein
VTAGEPPAPGRIVVGVSGSAASVAALAWAHDEAKLRGWTLDVVAAWPDLGEPAIHEVPGHYSVARGRAVDGLNAALAACGVELDGPTARIWVLNEDPVAALVGRCDGADLLVLGGAHGGRSRRLGQPTMRELCLGRVRCPVIQVDVPDGGLRSSA